MAFFLDWVWICFLLLFVVMLGPQLPPRWLPLLLSTAPVAAAAAFAAMESSSWQSSFGKRQMGMKVMRAQGGPVSLARALLRNGLKAVPWIAWPWLPLAWLYFWPAGWIALLAVTLSLGRRRAWYDYLARTAVIRVP